MLVAWEALAFANPDLPALPRLPLARRWRAAAAYSRACRIYARKGFPESKRYLLRLRQQFLSLGVSSSSEALRYARKELVFLRILGRLLGEDPACLPASVSLTAGLMGLGLRAQLVVGKSTTYLSEEFDFHAWVELDGYPVYEAPQVQKRFISLLRIPDWK